MTLRALRGDATAEEADPGAIPPIAAGYSKVGPMPPA